MSVCACKPMPGREAKFGDAYWVNRDSTDYPRALASPSVRWRAWRSVEAIPHGPVSAGSPAT